MAKLTQQADAFRDYYLLLQVHPEADFGMIDAAYWHLARRYNQAAVDDPSARARLDELNHAYTVLGSSKRREAYDRERNKVLGLGALPTLPPPMPEPMPLAVMERQRALPREEAGEAPLQRVRFSLRHGDLPLWQGILSAIILLIVASAAFGAWTHPAVLGGLLVLGIAFSTLPLLGGKRHRLPKVSLPSDLGPPSPPRQLGRLPHDAPVDPDELRMSMAATRERLRHAQTQVPDDLIAAASQPRAEPATPFARDRAA